MSYTINNQNNRHYYSKLYPHLMQYFNSRTAALLIDRLEYWFSRTTNVGFYKFLEPCNHKGYRHGHSWCEEIGIGRKCFNKAFDLIGVRYKSKTEYEAVAQINDPFQGKLYLSYYDRKHNQMYYLRNHHYTNQFLQSLFVEPKKLQQKLSVIPIDKQRDKRLSTLSITSIESSPQRTDNTSQEGRYRSSTNDRSLYIQRNTYKSSSMKTEAPVPISTLNTDHQEIGEKMHKIWLEEVGNCTVSTISLSLATRMVQFLKSVLNNCLKTWREYCRRIASSKFLMGEVNPKFKAWLWWVIKQPTFEKIKSGEFSLGDRLVNENQGQIQDYEALAEANIAQQSTEQDKSFS